VGWHLVRCDVKALTLPFSSPFLVIESHHFICSQPQCFLEHQWDKNSPLIKDACYVLVLA
jgi:hypothetical protein